MLIMRLVGDNSWSPDLLPCNMATVLYLRSRLCLTGGPYSLGHPLNRPPPYPLVCINRLLRLFINASWLPDQVYMAFWLNGSPRLHTQLKSALQTGNN